MQTDSSSRGQDNPRPCRRPCKKDDCVNIVSSQQIHKRFRFIGTLACELFVLAAGEPARIATSVFYHANRFGSVRTPCTFHRRDIIVDTSASTPKSVIHLAWARCTRTRTGVLCFEHVSCVGRRSRLDLYLGYLEASAGLQVAGPSFRFYTCTQDHPIPESSTAAIWWGAGISQRASCVLDRGTYRGGLYREPWPR